MSILSKLHVPAFFAGGHPQIDPGNYYLKIMGLVEEEMEFNLVELKRMPSSRVNARLTSVSGWSVRADWDGIKWKDFLKEIRLKPEATHVTFISHGGGYSTNVSLEDLDAPRVILVYGVAGEPLKDKYGGPLRSLVPNLYGYKSCKWLAEIIFTDQMKGGYWEGRGYSSSGFIEPGFTFDLNTGQRREIKGGEVLDF